MVSSDKVIKVEFTEPEFNILKEIVRKEVNKVYKEKLELENKYKDYSIVYNKLLIEESKQQ